MNVLSNTVREDLMKDIWRIKFTDQHALLINIPSHQLFVDGELLDLNIIEKNYTQHLLKEKNRFTQKKRIKTIFTKLGVLAIDVGWDGRIFFKVWNSKEAYARFRSKPRWCASYWNDKENQEIKIYVQDLKNPKYRFRTDDDIGMAGQVKDSPPVSYPATIITHLS